MKQTVKCRFFLLFVMFVFFVFSCTDYYNCQCAYTYENEHGVEVRGWYQFTVVANRREATKYCKDYSQPNWKSWQCELEK